MTQTIVWKIDYVDAFTSPVNSLEQVVKSCRWTAEITDVQEDSQGNTSTVTASNYGYCEFSEPDSESFINFNELSNATVLEWVWSKVDKEAVEAGLVDEVLRKRTPATVQLPLPL